MRATSSATNLLLRQSNLSTEPSGLSAAQLRLDALQQTFSTQATDGVNIAAMLSGSLAYRIGRTSLLGLGLSRPSAAILALGGEVTVFRGASNQLSRAFGRAIHEDVFDRRGWFTSLVHFASLKATAVFALGHNPLFTNALQSFTMVGASQLTYALDLTHQPQGGFWEQMMEAQVTNMALSTGASLSGMLIGPGLRTLEMSLDARSAALTQSRRIIASSQSIQRNVERLASQNIQTILPERTRFFERVLSPEDYFKSFSPELQAAFTSKIGERVVRMNEEDLGRNLGLLFEEHARALPSRDLARSELSPAHREHLGRLDEIVGVLEYAPRSNRLAITNAAFAAMKAGTRNRYGEIKQTLKHFLDVDFRALLSQKESLKLDEGMAAIGSGDMMALLHLQRHRIAPGELGWRTPLRVISRTDLAAKEINEKGTYKSNPSLSNVQINCQGDPPIEAVGPTGRDSHGLTPREILATYKVQFINVPSKELHSILTEDYIKSLPKGAILVDVIGGMIGPKMRGVYQPTQAEPKPLLLPFEFIRMALDRHGRKDVSVVSGGGYIPGKNLWAGERAEMTFAGEERGRGLAPAAETIAKLMAGPSLDNGFLAASFSHHQRSTELGKTLKNVTTLMAGFEAGRLARWVAETRAGTATGNGFMPQGGIVSRMMRAAVSVVNPQSEYVQQIREQIYKLMEGVLIHNEIGIKANRADYRQEVRNDFWKCSEINMEEVIRVFELARQVDVHNPDAMRTFLENEIVKNPNGIASTRNPKRGIAQAIVEMWRDMHSPYQISEVAPKITEEGVETLEPLMSLYDYQAHPIEKRYLDDLFYELFEAFHGVAAPRPPRIGKSLRSALNSEVPDLVPEQLREILQNKSQRSIDILEEETQNLIEMRASYELAGTEQVKLEDIKRQTGLLTSLRSALADGYNVQRIDRSLALESPYNDAYILRLSKAGSSDATTSQHRIFVRVKDVSLFKRLTEFGLLFRLFKEGTQVHLDLNVENLEDPKLIDDMSDTLMSVLADYATQRQLKIGVGISYPAARGNRTLTISAKPSVRKSLNDAYFAALQALVDRLKEAEPNVTAQDVRNEASHLSELLNGVLYHRASNLLLGYRGGMIHKALKAALTRPERSTLIGIYDEADRLVDVVAVYRDNENKPRIICHHIMKEMNAAITSSLKSLRSGVSLGSLSRVMRRGAHAMGLANLEDPPSEQYYSGIPLEEFLTHYPQTLDAARRDKIHYGILRLQSLPLEEALVGRIPGVNPGLLRLFLRDEAQQAKELALQLMPYYEADLSDRKAEIAELMNRFLRPYEVQYQTRLSAEPLYRHFARESVRSPE